MNKYIQRLIKEQFNINDLDLSDDADEYDSNIFNKEFNHPYYKKVLDGTVTEVEIKELNSFIGAATPNSKQVLQKIIKYYSENYPEDSLNWLDVSEITDMSELFTYNIYNGDISKWDTSSVFNMKKMFYAAYPFNQPISEWNVSNVIDMSYMFCNTRTFNQPIGNWNVSNVTDMSCMFHDTDFNQDISQWDVSHVKSMKNMFSESNFDQDISQWDVHNVTNMSSMFSGSSFNGDISHWDVHNVTNMTSMFSRSLFKGDISQWDVHNVKYYMDVFLYCRISKENKPQKFI